MSSEIVLAVDGLSKRYEIYSRPVRRLWQLLLGRRWKFYREFWALRDVSFEIRRGESWGIVGRNGAGKSTLLQIVTGTLRATQGKVRRKGGLKIAALLQLGSGFNPDFTGRENVFLNASILGLSRRETEARYEDIIRFADIGDFIDQPVKKYSSGMKVRLAFAVQIMVEPDVLIVDEALSVGDMFFQQKCMHYMRKLRECGCTLLFVSHNLGTVRSLCDHGIYLKDGRVEMIGGAEEVCNAYWTGGQSKPSPLDRTIVAPRALSEASALSELAAPSVVGVWTPEKASFVQDPTLAGKMSERAGNGKVRFTGFRSYNVRGEAIGLSEYGQDVVVSASVMALEDVPEGAVFAFSVNTKECPGVAFHHSLLQDKVLPALRKGDRMVLTSIFRLPFLKGRFFFNFSLSTSATATDYYDHVYSGLCLDVTVPADLREKNAWGLVRFDRMHMVFIRHGRVTV